MGQVQRVKGKKEKGSNKLNRPRLGDGAKTGKSKAEQSKKKRNGSDVEIGTMQVAHLLLLLYGVDDELVFWLPSRTLLHCS